MPEPAQRVAVSRTGGFAGIRRHGELTMGEDPRTDEVSALLNRIDFAALPTRPAQQSQPDRFVYTFDVSGQTVVVGEQDLTPELRQLAATLFR